MWEFRAGNSLVWNMISVQWVSLESGLSRQPSFREEVWENQKSLMKHKLQQSLWVMDKENQMGIAG